MSPDAIARLMQEADVNHDKLIDLKEFKTLWNDRGSFAQQRAPGSHFNAFFSSVVASEAPPTIAAQEQGGSLLDLFIGAPQPHSQPQQQPTVASATSAAANLIDI